jgi:hypothetical protein
MLFSDKIAFSTWDFPSKITIKDFYTKGLLLSAKKRA